MANALNVELTGKTVVFNNMKPEFKDTKFKVEGGFGASPFTAGTALFGTFEDGEEARMSGYDVRAIVEDDPALDALVAKKNSQ